MKVKVMVNSKVNWNIIKSNKSLQTNSLAP